MSRFIKQGVVRDGRGNVIGGARVSVFLAGTETPAKIYEEFDSVSYVNHVRSDEWGGFKFYVDDTDYGMAQAFKIVLSLGSRFVVWERVFMREVVYGSDVYALAYGDVLNDITINAAIAGVGTDNRTIVVSAGTWIISDDLTIPANIGLKVEQGGILEVASGKTLTIEGPFEAGLYQVFAPVDALGVYIGSEGFDVATSGEVVFGRDSATEVKSSWFGNGGDSVQKAIYAAVNVKVVTLPAGVIPVYRPIIIPSATPYWGTEIRGTKNNQSYQALSTSYSTTLKAMAVVDVVIGNRAAINDVSGHYNKVTNLTIDGNNLAEIGYLNGYQDTLEYCSAIRCTEYGIVFGDYTNSTTLRDCASINNYGSGIWCTGRFSTVSIINNTRIRENAKHGIVLTRAGHLHFSDGIIESNSLGSTLYSGIKVDHSIFTGDGTVYTVATFWSSYLENNNYDLDGTDATIRSNVIFNNCYINDSKTSAIKGAISVEFNRCFFTPTTIDISEPAICRVIEARGSNPVLIGTGTDGIWKEELFFENSTYFKRIGNNLPSVVKSRNIGYQYSIGTDKVLTVPEVSGTTIINYNQDEEDITVTLPLEDLLASHAASFVYIIHKSQNHNYITFTTGSVNRIILDGVAVTSISGTAEYGKAIRFTYFDYLGSGRWLAEPIHGTFAAV